MIRRLLAALLLLTAPAWATTNYENVVSAETPPPCHWWKLNDTSGSTAVDTPSDGCGASSGAYTGSPSLNQAASGVVGGVSVAFNGSTQWEVADGGGSCPFRPATGAGANQHMSWEWWGRVTNGTQAVQATLGSDETTPSPAGGWLGFMGGTGISAGVFEIGANDNGFANTYREVDSTTLFSVNLWRYFAATWDGSASSGTLKLYVGAGGTLNLEATTTTGAGTCCGCAEYATSGAILAKTTPVDKLTGNVQFLAIYGGAGSSHGSTTATLTLTQATNHYNAGLSAGNTAAGWWQASAPHFPAITQPGYIAAVVARGYTTGLFAPSERWWGYLPVGYAFGSVMPRGDVGLR